ncbi:spermatogenesis-associated protein 1 isoform X1 [Gouania willdenowi]|uniref:spermatogenesis-associated protein 1 isoform X1 n=1 Tax=Gouania willdenowi TaxID=441366 RepID=UPI0010557158|nr:spermatogenesis-associated protein 1 isoform X1 [Gouania willdenowi]
MELSCESLRCAVERRPTSSKLVELHVLFVPVDQWNMKLNKVSADATESFISAGFIRVYPDITLKTLRGELGALLSAERSMEKFSFLKCVGRSLALVKSKQEGDLKVKTFAPPYAAQPELYLLLTAENDSSVCSQSLTPDTSSSFPEHQIYYQTPNMSLNSPPTRTKEPVKFPHIPQCSQQPFLNHKLEEEEEENQSSNSSEELNEEDSPSSVTSEQRCCPGKRSENKALQWPEMDCSQQKEEETFGQGSQYQRAPKGARACRPSGVCESLEDRRAGLSYTERVVKSNEAHRVKRITTKQTPQNPAVHRGPIQCTSPPPAVTVDHKTAFSSIVHTNRGELIEEIKLVREERKRLEWTRQELLRKGKDLLAQNRHRRNQARDSWKKKYFETKKATAPLEDTLRNSRQELETFFNKVLHQLQARDSRGKPRRQGRTSTKNELIIQITTENYEIDNLKRKIEDAKMKLLTEIKVNKHLQCRITSTIS